jgi:hypothetical protein
MSPKVFELETQHTMLKYHVKNLSKLARDKTRDLNKFGYY